MSLSVAEAQWDYLTNPTPLAEAIGGQVRLMGYSLRETAGLAAVVILRSGTDATGLEVAGVHLNPNESVRDWFGPFGIYCSAGLLASVTGAVAGSLWVGGLG